MDDLLPKCQLPKKRKNKNKNKEKIDKKKEKKIETKNASLKLDRLRHYKWEKKIFLQ